MGPSAELSADGTRVAAGSRAALRARLDARRPEIENAARARVDAISSPSAEDPVYAGNLRTAVSAALDYAFDAIERGEGHAPPPPPLLLAQARIAARDGVGLDTVLRRYLAGYSLIGHYAASEAGRDNLIDWRELQTLLGTLAVLFDELVAAVSDEHSRERARLVSSPEQRRYERVARLLAGETVDTTSLMYEFDACHTGVVADGVDLAGSLRKLARELDCRLLLVERHETVALAWLGSRRPLHREALERAAQELDPSGATIGVGLPARELPGWRLTHRQAAAALSVGLHRGDPWTLYADVPLPAALHRDDLFAHSLTQLYVTPFNSQADGGATMRRTLRAYFDSGQNLTAAGAALGVSRQTVASRLRTAEVMLGRPVRECTKELELALELVSTSRHHARLAGCPYPEPVFNGA